MLSPSFGLSKPCRLCRAVKSLDDFPADYRCADKRASRCRACESRRVNAFRKAARAAA
jgi:hypothetical protein